MFIRPLPPGPVDIVGDVHGWLEPLERLLARLGYGPQGEHPAGRRLVFLGDVVDRGPASLAVLERVRELVDSGRALLVLGNHELNLLVHREPRRGHGNAWFFALPPSRQEELRAWIEAQPLALERPDLRVVHACWDPGAVARLAAGPSRPLRPFWEELRQGLRRRAETEEDPVRRDLLRQNEDPVKVLTSGLEVPAPEPYEAGGRLRRTARDPWWERYREGPAVVFGHYWRSLSGEPVHAAGFRYLFAGIPALAPLGPGGRAWCIDYSMGAGLRRGAGLAALRWPEGELVVEEAPPAPGWPQAAPSSPPSSCTGTSGTSAQRRSSA